MSVGNIAAATAAHVHEGKAGVNGPPVITIAVTGPKNEACVEADRKLLKKIADKPGDYYVNVHTGGFPRRGDPGAIAVVMLGLPVGAASAEMR